MSIASHFFALIDYRRRSGAADDLSAAFVRDPALHRIPEQEANEDEIGKAIPEPVISRLDAHLHLLGRERARGHRAARRRPRPHPRHRHHRRRQMAASRRRGLGRLRGRGQPPPP